jgi:hypothetical protein
MLISDLQNRLRKVIEQRIAAGVLTGTILAKETGFKQAHISNFIHGHRGLSVEGFDRLLRALSIRATDLIECGSPRKVESQDYDEIPLVAGATANQPNFGAADVEELVRFQRAFGRAWLVDAATGDDSSLLKPTGLMRRQCTPSSRRLLPF